MDCFGTYFTYAQSCDNLRVQSAAEWTASVQNQTTRKREHFLPVSSFRVSVFLCFSHLRASLIASAIIDCSVFLLSAKTAFLLCAFSRFCRFRVFAVFAFSFLPVFVLGVSAVFAVFGFSRFRVFVFRRRHPRGRDTDFVCTGVECSMLIFRVVWIHAQVSSPASTEARQSGSREGKGGGHRSHSHQKAEQRILALFGWWFQIFFIFIPVWGRFPF